MKIAALVMLSRVWNVIAGFTAEVFRENRRMQDVFHHSGLKVRSQLVEGLYHFQLDF
jgi:hypothetical protein